MAFIHKKQFMPKSRWREKFREISQQNVKNTIKNRLLKCGFVGVSWDRQYITTNCEEKK